MPDKNSIWGGVISIGLHVFVLAFLFVTLPVPTHNDEPEHVDVELVEPAQPPEEEHYADPSDEAAPPQAFESAVENKDDNAEIEPLSGQENPSEAPELVEPVEETAEQKKDEASGDDTVLSAEKSNISVNLPEKNTIKMVAAKQIYSDAALSDPRVKQALGTLSAKQRVSQICSIEALEQIRHARPDTPPDMMARKASELTETSLKMRGGAFRSHAKWYDVDFTCEINLNDMKVSSFNYTLGNLIPENDWQRRGLLAD
ncbi:DUF930 domain-containing protein [Paenochrobactrum pullorum]|uniref:DUF930 domain-containing protein n=1 Tax=Paenochrobactrum pullorum TaxID=1324351 RepID=UPI0035BC3530